MPLSKAKRPGQQTVAACAARAGEETSAMAEVEPSAGTIEYQVTGGDGPVLVFLPGLTTDGSLWREVVPGLAPGYRCVLPTLPLGGHRRPIRPGLAATMRLPEHTTTQ